MKRKNKISLRKAAQIALEALKEEHTEDCNDTQAKAIRVLKEALGVKQ